MTAPIFNALSQGFTSKQIVDYLIRLFPQHSEKIRSAVSMGFNPKQILSFLSGGRQELNRSDFGQGIQTEHEKTIQSEEQRRQAINKAAIGLGGAAVSGLGGYALSRALPQLAQKVAPELTQKAVGAIKRTLGSTPTQTTETALEPTIAPEIKPGANIGAILSKFPGFEKKINDLRSAGNDPSKISAYFQSFNPSQIQKIEKESGLSFEKLIEDYVAQTPISKQELKTVQPPSEKLDVSKETERPQEETIGNLALLPQGQVGEIESVKNGIARINVDGNIKHRKVDDLVQSPKESAVAARELIKSFTPEQMRSAHHTLSMYDPDTNEAYFLFHDGSGYKAEGISPEEYEQLSTEVEAAKTSGQTGIAAWSAGEGSRGAAYNKIVKGVRDRKVVPELKKKVKKLKIGYNLFQEFQRLLHEEEKERKKLKS